MTSLCYLDGRVIARAARDAGCHFMYNHCMYVNIEETVEGNIKSYSVTMDTGGLLDSMNIIRVIIVSQYIRHSALVFLDLASKSAGKAIADLTSDNLAYWWNPRQKNKRSDILNAGVKTLVREYLKTIRPIRLISLDGSVPVVAYQCKVGGLCNAFVLKYILDWFNGVDPNFDNIHEFAKSMTDRYRWILSTGEPDLEYDFNPSGSLLGGLGGALIGGAVAGPIGMLAGGTLGAVGGGALGNNRVRSYSMSDADACK